MPLVVVPFWHGPHAGKGSSVVAAGAKNPWAQVTQAEPFQPDPGGHAHDVAPAVDVAPLAQGVHSGLGFVALPPGENVLGAQTVQVMPSAVPHPGEQYLHDGAPVSVRVVVPLAQGLQVGRSTEVLPPAENEPAAHATHELPICTP